MNLILKPILKEQGNYHENDLGMLIKTSQLNLFFENNHYYLIHDGRNILLTNNDKITAGGSLFSVEIAQNIATNEVNNYVNYSNATSTSAEKIQINNVDNNNIFASSSNKYKLSPKTAIFTNGSESITKSNDLFFESENKTKPSFNELFCNNNLNNEKNNVLKYNKTEAIDDQNIFNNTAKKPQSNTVDLYNANKNNKSLISDMLNNSANSQKPTQHLIKSGQNNYLRNNHLLQHKPISHIEVSSNKSTLSYTNPQHESISTFKRIFMFLGVI